MNSPEQQWWSVRAGEYVLGTLRGEDLKLFEQILAHDTTLQSEVTQWERHLAGLNAMADDQSPGLHVWPQILERVRCLDDKVPISENDQAIQNTDTVSKISAHYSDSPTVNSAITHGRRTVLWPTIAALASAASLILGVLLFQRSTEPSAYPLSVDGLAVVLSDESGEPYFLVETDYGSLRVRVTALSPPSIDETRDFQLWQALPDRSSVMPVALLPEDPGTAIIFDVDSLIDGSDLFGVSIEPVGAATEAGPTGPVVAHGDFLPTRNVE